MPVIFPKTLLTIQLVVESVLFEESTFFKKNPDVAKWELQENFVVWVTYSYSLSLLILW